MRNHVLFHMWGPFRESLISGHLFYVDQARKRLLSQFDDIEAEADKAANEWLEQRDSFFDPDRHDPADFYEGAHEAGIEFYGLLSDMRTQTWLSVVAGMFHEWDKKLRGWFVSEIERWHRGENLPKKIWSADFTQICQFLESMGWCIHTTEYFPKLDACRLVVNVYKHGDGKSLDDLKEKYPEYLDDRFNRVGFEFLNKDYRDHTHLKVSEEQFQNFSDAIVAFWRAVPENMSESDVRAVPNWLEKSFMKDRASEQQSKLRRKQ